MKKSKLYLLAAASALVLSAGNGVYGEEAAIAVDIESQPVGSAVIQLAKTFGVQIMLKEVDSQYVDVSQLQGRFTLDEAMVKLLKGTGLVYEKTADNVLVVKMAPVGKNSADSELWTGLEEIVVTATRREASMQDLPMSINAFSGDRLKESGVHAIDDMQFLAAGLYVSSSNGLTKVTLRGVGSDQFTVGAESGVSMHRDGVYIVQRPEIGLGFLDVERVEVLRGPQGTLYGRNATGGAVNIISKSPTSEFEAGGSVTLGNYDSVETEGYASGPFKSDSLMARFAFKTRDHDGYTPNIFNGGAEDNADSMALRSIFRYQPTDRFYLDLTADYARDDSVAATVYSRLFPETPLLVETLGRELPSGRKINHDNGGLNDKEVWGGSAKAEWDLGGMTFTSLTAYREFRWLQSFEQDASDLRIFYIEQERRETKQISQEVTLGSSAGSAFEWIVGAYYFYGNEWQSGNTFFDIPDGSSGVYHFFTDDYTTDAYAVFGEASYSVIDRLMLTLGIRYSYEEKSIAGGALFLGETRTETLADDWNSLTPKAALTYTFNDEITAYFTIGKGFKAGGYNGTLGNPLGAYDQENVINYEVGLKTELFDHRLQANIAVFYMDYSDYQALVFRPNPFTGTTSGVIENAATSANRGIEIDLQMRPMENLSLDANISWLDAKFEKFTDAPDASRGGATFDVSGNRLPNAPEWVINLGANYTLPVGDWGTATLRSEYSYRSEVFFTVFEEPRDSQEGVGLLNARLTFEDAQSRWSIAAWAKNIGDKEVVTFISGIVSTISGPRKGTTYAPPYTYGVTVGYRF